MLEHTIKMPGGEWMRRSEIRSYLGLADEQIERLIKAGILVPEGKGQGQRFDWQEVFAVSRLWRRLSPFLPPEEK